MQRTLQRGLKVPEATAGAAESGAVRAVEHKRTQRRAATKRPPERGRLCAISVSNPRGRPRNGPNAGGSVSLWERGARGGREKEAERGECAWGARPPGPPTTASPLPLPPANTKPPCGLSAPVPSSLGPARGRPLSPPLTGGTVVAAAPRWHPARRGPRLVAVSCLCVVEQQRAQSTEAKERSPSHSWRMMRCHHHRTDAGRCWKNVCRCSEKWWK